MPINALFPADQQSQLCTQLRSQRVQSKIHICFLQMYYLEEPVLFFLMAAFLDGCNALIKIMKVWLSTFLKGCWFLTIYCHTRFSNCGWEMKAELLLLWLVIRLWLVDDPFCYVAPVTLDVFVTCTYIERLAGGFISQCFFKLAVDVVDVRSCFWRPGEYSLHRNYCFLYIYLFNLEQQ